jgi:FK506-binding protein 2
MTCSILQLLTWNLSSAQSQAKNPDSVDIESYFKPEECEGSAQTGQHIEVHYKGWYSVDGSDDTVFGESKHEDGTGKPLMFTMGKGEVIEGWEKGVSGMCVGEKRIVIIPPKLAFGDSDSGGHIPKGATLKLDLELLNITATLDEQHAATLDEDSMRGFFDSVDYNSDGKLSPEELYNYLTHFGKGQAAHADEMLTDIHGTGFSAHDTDGDGLLTFEEWHPSKRAAITHGEL